MHDQCRRRAQRARPNVLIVFFKSMKRDLKGTVRKVAQFLDIEAPEELIEFSTALLILSSFSREPHSRNHGLTP